MKNTIIYFTGTGNSLVIARLLAEKLLPANIVSVNQLLQCAPLQLDTDTCGFVFPVYCQDTPEIVRRLVHLIQIPKNTYIFAIATYNRDIGYSHFTLDKILRKKGQRLSAGFAVLMPGNSIVPYYSMNSDEEVHRRLQAASSCAEKIADQVTMRASLPYEGSASLRKHLKGFRNMLRHKLVRRVPQQFWSTTACNLCGICTRICPENNIFISSNKIRWGRHCQMCQACIQWCPQQAVQNGEKTVNLKRYHHPDISIDDMLCRK